LLEKKEKTKLSNIYKDRHCSLYDELLNNFPDKQFLITTHSPILVSFQYGEKHFKGYIPEKYLYDIEQYKQRRNEKCQTTRERGITFKHFLARSYIHLIHVLKKWILMI
jgi:hypothetical protein